MSDATKPPRMFGASTVRLPEGQWRTVLDCLADRFPTISREIWADRMQRGRVLDERGTAVTVDQVYAAGLRVHYFREVSHEPEVPFEARILYQDAHLVVADKPHFLPVVPSGPYVEQTLLARLSRALDNPDLVPLHRLDRLTAGLVMFSCQPKTRNDYLALFRERRIRKQYEAIAPGLPNFAFPYVRKSRLVPGEPFILTAEVEGESNSETRMDVTECTTNMWRYSLEPVTGRKHQLRVHMNALGAPILNDPFYPVLAPQDTPDDYTRPLKLLARTLDFVDPITGHRHRFESERRLDF